MAVRDPHVKGKEKGSSEARMLTWGSWVEVKVVKPATTCRTERQRVGDS